MGNISPDLEREMVIGMLKQIRRELEELRQKIAANEETNETEEQPVGWRKYADLFLAGLASGVGSLLSTAPWVLLAFWLVSRWRS